jgi:HSP20 family protein
MARKEKSFFGKIMGGDISDPIEEEEIEFIEQEELLVDDSDSQGQGTSIHNSQLSDDGSEGYVSEGDADDDDDEEEPLIDPEEEFEEDADDAEAGYDSNYESGYVEESQTEVPHVPIEYSEEVETVRYTVETPEIEPSYEEVEATSLKQTSNSMQNSTPQNEQWENDYEGALNIDMYQTKDNVIIKSTIAGVRPDDIDITVANDMVTIKGTRQREEKVSNDDYFYQECYWGSFSRSVIVPVDIDSEEIEADLKDGILTIIIPKAAKAKTKKVKVKGM